MVERERKKARKKVGREGGKKLTFIEFLLCVIRNDYRNMILGRYC